MTNRRLTRALALCGVAALGIFSIIASGGPTPPADPPAAPILLSLEIPNDVFGKGFSGITPALAARPEVPATATNPATPAVPANYFVLPLLTTIAPIARATLELPANSVISVTATDASRNETATLPIVSPPGPNSPGPTTGYVYLHSITSNSSTYYIRYPNSFQGSRAIRTSITDAVGGVASLPLAFDLTFRGSTLTVSIASENNDGRVISNPPGIDCPGVCTFAFLSSTSVSLSQGVKSNSTEFIGWTGSCSGSGACVVQMLAPGPAIIPVNAGVTANFRIHTNTAIPITITCAAAREEPGWRWVTQPNCGSPPPTGATLSCNPQGYFCCGPSGGNNSPRCNGGNETAATCAKDSMGVFGTSQRLIQPGGCYEPAR